MLWLDLQHGAFTEAWFSWTNAKKYLWRKVQEILIPENLQCPDLSVKKLIFKKWLF